MTKPRLEIEFEKGPFAAPRKRVRYYLIWSADNGERGVLGENLERVREKWSGWVVDAEDELVIGRAGIAKQKEALDWLDARLLER